MICSPFAKDSLFNLARVLALDPILAPHSLSSILTVISGVSAGSFPKQRLVIEDILAFKDNQFNKLMSVFRASVLLLIMSFVITLSK